MKIDKILKKYDIKRSCMNCKHLIERDNYEKSCYGKFICTLVEFNLYDCHEAYKTVCRKHSIIISSIYTDDIRFKLKLEKYAVKETK